MRLKLIMIVCVAFAVGAGGGFLQYTFGGRAPMVRMSGTALIGGPFEMVDHNGRTVTDKDFPGKYKLVMFGFTNCPDVCPATLQVTEEALQALGPAADRLVPFFVTVDPARDTADALKDYLSNFDKRIVGLTGTASQVRGMTKAYRVYSSKVNDPSLTDGYAMDHSAYSYLMSPEGLYIAHFSFGTSVADLTKRLQSVLGSG